MPANKIVQPVGVNYVSLTPVFEDVPVLHVLFQYKLQDPGKIYNIQYTNDGITYFSGGSVTGVAHPTFTIDPRQKLWPRVVEA